MCYPADSESAQDRKGIWDLEKAAMMVAPVPDTNMGEPNFTIQIRKFGFKKHR